MPSVLKVIGADFELTNALQIPGSLDGRPDEASRLLLAELPGYPGGVSGGTNIELGRRFSPDDGSSQYIDSTHLEANLAEHTQSSQSPLLLHAALARVRHAQQSAALHIPRGATLSVIANCSDRQQSWGAHLNVLMDEDAFLDLCYFKPHYAQFLATHLVTSILFTGQGQVGAGNQRPACDFQLSQRADWFSQFYGLQTMYDRPLINLRAEHHAQSGLARCHIIYFDQVLCPVANRLKFGSTQLVLAMIEQGWVDPSYLLDDPVGAASEISRDLRLTQLYPTTVRGRSLTALEFQQALVDQAAEFVASGAAGGIVPEAQQIVAQWQEVLDLLRQRELEALAQRCDNWLKFVLIDRYRTERGLGWQSAECQMLDLMFGSLDPEEGLFFQMARAGAVKDMPTEQQIADAIRRPPDDTRAYLRAHVLRKFGHLVSTIDWSYINFRVPSGRSWWSIARLPMPDPRRWGQDETEAVLAHCESLEDLVEAVIQQTDAQQCVPAKNSSSPPRQPAVLVGDPPIPQNGLA